MSRAIDLGPVEAAAVRTPSGKIRLRLLLTADQLEAMLIAAREDDPRDVTQRDASTDNVTPRLDETREEGDEDDDVRARPLPPTAPVGRRDVVFVYEGTRAWDEWLKTGHQPRLSVRRQVDGRTRSGWHFPTLFPPTAATATGPPTQPQTPMNEQDYADMAGERK